MEPERWKQVDNLLQLTLQQPSDGRQTFLRQACAGDDALEHEVLSLLAFEGQAGNFLERPAIHAAARELASRQAAHSNERGLTGRTISHYRILEKAGAGGMGMVYKAQDTRLHRFVALKFLPDELARDPQALQRFQREARAASALNHPGIVTVFDTGSEDGLAYLVTEFVDGTTLRQSRPETMRRQLDTAAQVADALAVAHAAGITHRDLKPENIMVTREGRAKILDFGLAIQAAPALGEETLTALNTMPGTVLGTVGYMSPEQARGRAADHRSDIFSLGAVMYELFNGQRAFTGETPADTLSAILKNDPPDLPASVSTGVRQIVAHCLEKEAARRFQSAHDLALSLRAMAGSGVSTHEAIAAPVARAWRLGAWPTVVGFALAALLGVGFWRLASEPRPLDMSDYRFQPFATEDYAEVSPVWSPDGKSIAYITRRGPGSEVVVKSADGSPPVILAHNPYPFPISSLSWTPDGSRVNYIAATGFGYGPVLSIARAGGDPLTVLKGDAYAAALSPDGRILAWLKRKTSNGRPQRTLILSTPPGSPGRPLLSFPGWALQNRVSWSRDGAKILVWLQNSQVWLVNVRSGEGRIIGNPPPAMVLNASWLPDNRRVLIPRAKDGPFGNRLELWVLDTETGQRSIALTGTESVLEPSLSPDGNAIAFVTGPGGIVDFDLAEFPLDGSPVRTLLATRQWEDSVAWSPVGPEYAYVTLGAIRLRRRDGSLDRQIVTPSEFGGDVSRFCSVSFSPNGSRIVYVVFNNGRKGKAWISPVSGGAPAPLGEVDGSVSGTSWSPDGRWVAFNWAPGPQPGSRLAMMRIGAADQPVVLAKDGCSFAPSWSPDGSRILCSVGDELAIVPTAGGQPRLLGKGYEPFAAWSRDIDRVYVIRNDGATRQLGSLDLKSGAFHRIVDVPTEWVFNTPMINTGTLSLSSDAKSLATTIAKPMGDIWIVKGFHPSPSLWQRLWGR